MIASTSLPDSEPMQVVPEETARLRAAAQPAR